jgi:hypothetical protein
MLGRFLTSACVVALPMLSANGTYMLVILASFAVVLFKLQELLFKMGFI